MKGLRRSWASRFQITADHHQDIFHRVKRFQLDLIPILIQSLLQCPDIANHLRKGKHSNMEVISLTTAGSFGWVTWCR